MDPSDHDDLEAIRQLKARYFRLMDEKDWDALADVFTDDVEMDMRGAPGAWSAVRSSIPDPPDSLDHPPNGSSDARRRRSRWMGQARSPS